MRPPEKRARDYTAEVMRGQTDIAAVPDKLRQQVIDIMQLHVWQKATAIVALDTRTGRVAALEQIPATYRSLVEDEARRQFEKKRSISVRV
jgi:hypothetical protein